ncbi:MAG: hypothetical protein WDO19_33080 [Bacteroidota bacterium]
MKRPVLPNDYRYYDYRIIAYENGQLAFIAMDSDENTYEIKYEQLFVLLSQTESKHLDNYFSSFVLLYRAFRFCNILAERGAFLPRLFKADKENYRVQWIPAVINTSVKKVFDDLLQWYPANMLQISDPANPAKNKPAKSKSPLLPAKPEEALTLLCSFFANESVKACYNNVWRNTKTSNQPGRKINELFF